ncbi:MAG: hypothetical protein ACE5KJ_06690, partial [Candidatus Zixiibacteriota bacterium]
CSYGFCGLSYSGEDLDGSGFRLAQQASPLRLIIWCRLLISEPVEKPKDALMCHSERSEESNNFNKLRRRDSSPYGSE